MTQHHDLDALIPLAECFKIAPARQKHFAQDADREIQNHITRWEENRFARKYQKAA